MAVTTSPTDAWLKRQRTAITCDSASVSAGDCFLAMVFLCLKEFRVTATDCNSPLGGLSIKELKVRSLRWAIVRAYEAVGHAGCGSGPRAGSRRTERGRLSGRLANRQR